MKVENFSDEKVREMAANVLMEKITITQSSFDAMKARCSLFDEMLKSLIGMVDWHGKRDEMGELYREGMQPHEIKAAMKCIFKAEKL